MFRRILAFALLCATPALAQTPTTTETIEVTATRIAEDVVVVPASITIIDGDELRARNATDLASALGWTAGVNATGGWEVALWAKNLTNKDYLAEISNPNGISWIGKPRQWGLEVSKRF